MADKKDAKKPFEIKKGGFHEWLGKDPSEPITDEDIEKGLKSDDPHARRMAQFVKNQKKFKHPKKKPAEKSKVATETIAGEAPAWQQW